MNATESVGYVELRLARQFVDLPLDSGIQKVT